MNVKKSLIKLLGELIELLNVLIITLGEEKEEKEEEILIKETTNNTKSPVLRTIHEKTKEKGYITEHRISKGETGINEKIIIHGKIKIIE